MAEFVGDTPDMYEVGMRVCDSEGYRATVRYIGPVVAAKNKEEIWLGVEWDNHTRGKHDGSCVDDSGNLVRYFTCAFGAGSFVKIGKVIRGRSMLDALRDRYVDLDAPTVTLKDATMPDAFFLTSKGNKKGIEFVGEEKIRQRQQLSLLDKISLRFDNVSVVGNDLGPVISHVNEVDLQDNLLWKWNEVARIGQQIPGLKVLLLHNNRMEQMTSAVASSFPP